MGDVLQWPGGGKLGELDVLLITKAQAAAFLEVSERTVDRMVVEGAPVHRIRNRPYFRRAELRAWYDGRRT